MSQAKWTRWGWGSCEGYGLALGRAFRAQVVAVRSPEGQGGYRASINTQELGVHADREAAMQAVEREIESEMAGLLADWTVYSALKQMNGGKVPRDKLHARRRR